MKDWVTAGGGLSEAQQQTGWKSMQSRSTISARKIPETGIGAHALSQQHAGTGFS